VARDEIAQDIHDDGTRYPETAFEAPEYPGTLNDDLWAMIVARPIRKKRKKAHGRCKDGVSGLKKRSCSPLKH